MTWTIRDCDKGTEYARALTAYEETGSRDATDAQAMAAFCEDVMQTLAGAYSPRLVWEGAQKAGLTTMQLLKLCDANDRAALDDLQFS